MKRLLLATIALATLSIYSAGCNLTSGSSNQRLSGNGASDDPIACSTDADCPTGYECEVKAEHGTTTSLCKPHDETETEAENEAGDDKSATGAGADDKGADDKGATGAGTDDPAGADDSATGAGTDDSPGADDSATGTDAGSNGTGAIGAVCATDADCSAGLECEVEIEHGVTTATCQAHKSGKI